jgi:hypothetical protein
MIWVHELTLEESRQWIVEAEGVGCSDKELPAWLEEVCRSVEEFTNITYVLDNLSGDDYLEVTPGKTWWKVFDRSPI